MPTRLAELRRLLRVDEHATFPLWLKVTATVFYVFISRGTWQQYSAFNFLWFSHIGLMGLVLTLWLESRLLASMMLLNAFVADGVGWTLDLLVALVSGRHPFGATAYMFDQRIPILVRCLALFHVLVPALLLWMVYRLRYERRARANAASLGRASLLRFLYRSSAEHQLRLWPGHATPDLHARMALFHDLDGLCAARFLSADSLATDTTVEMGSASRVSRVMPSRLALTSPLN